MNSKNDYQFEAYERYHGGIDEVKKTIEDCPQCQAKMVLSHYSDSGNLILHETARCIECDYGQRKIIHSLN
jgi:C4-type Zn-finger protein